MVALARGWRGDRGQRQGAESPSHRSVRATQSVPMWAMVGGRDLGAPSAPLRARARDRWSNDRHMASRSRDESQFLARHRPAGRDFAWSWGVRSTGHLGSCRGDGSRTPPVAIRQFDVQPEGALMYGFGEGWHEEEYDNATGQRWRWTSERSVLQDRPAADCRVSNLAASRP